MAHISLKTYFQYLKKMVKITQIKYTHKIIT